VGAELFYADGQTDMTKLIVAFRNCAKAHGESEVINVYAVMSFRGLEVQFHLFLISALNGGAWSAEAVLLPVPVKYETELVAGPEEPFWRRGKVLFACRDSNYGYSTVQNCVEVYFVL
jgi:hypothetical protein